MYVEENLTRCEPEDEIIEYWLRPQYPKMKKILTVTSFYILETIILIRPQPPKNQTEYAYYNNNNLRNKTLLKLLHFLIHNCSPKICQ